MISLKKKWHLPILALLCVLGILYALKPRLPYKALSFETHALGTRCRLTLYMQDPAGAGQVAEAVFAELKSVENKSNLYDPHSEVSLLNAQRNMRLSPELYAILDRSLYYARWSQGAFDPTVGALTLAYRVTTDPSAVSRIWQSQAAGIGWQNLWLDPYNQVGALRHPLTQVDVWGASKGYAADRALLMFKALKVPAALLDLGGQITVWGQDPAHGDWPVGIEDPRQPNALLGKIMLQSGQTLASSSLSQHWPLGEAWVTHPIFDPRLKTQVKPGYTLVSVCAESGLDADILSTTLFVLGKLETLSLPPSINVLTLDTEGKLWHSPTLVFAR